MRTQAPDSPSPAWIDSDTLAQWLADGEELALIDTGERGQFGSAHLLQASNLPFSRLELDLPARVPRRQTRTVLVAPDDALALQAHAAAQALGYANLHLLTGGTAAWAASGRKTFQGVNVPSKAFAEFIEKTYHTGHIAPAELVALQRQGADLILLDSRTVEEHRRFHVPQAIACPGSELVARFGDLVPSPDTLVVVTCAGRTRGVVGAQTLINAGVPNRVVALAGGTQGWRLAGLELERRTGQESRPASTDALDAARQRAAAVEARFDLHRIDLDTLERWQADDARTTFVFDIRTQAEYEAGHWPGSAWVQGVQLIQTLDEWVVVRNASVVLVDTDRSRAVLVAHWLQQLGARVSLLETRPEHLSAQDPAPASPVGAPTGVPLVDASQARAWLDAGAVLLDASSSAAYRQRHPAGAHWVNRSALSQALQQQVATAGKVLVLAEDDGVARLLAHTLAEHAETAVLQGGLATWEQAGLPVASTPEVPTDAQRIDYLFWLHDRHEGNLQASAQYLQWEERLPELVGDPAEAGFRLP